MDQQPQVQKRSLIRKVFGFARIVLSSLACLALLASLFAPWGDAEIYRTTGWIALGAAALLALPFDVLDGRRNKRAIEEKARAMTSLQRMSSGLDG